MCRHRWTKEDDILIFYLYRYGEDGVITKEAVANCIFPRFYDNKKGSLNMRIGNFRYLDTGEGLSNFANLTKKVYQEYRYVDQATHKQECKVILGV